MAETRTERRVTDRMMAAAPQAQVPGLMHRRVGEIVVSAVSDGFLNGSNATLQGIAQEEVAAMLVGAFRPTPRRTAINTFLVWSAGRVALIDTGCGPHLQPSAGKLFAHLAAAGVPPEAVDTVLLTHLHPDHANGLADVHGEALFPHAELALHQAELAYWRDEAAAARAAATGQGVPYFAAAQAQLAPYRDRLKPFVDGAEVFPGVTAVHLPGHTPGHCGFRISSGHEQLLIWGDIVHVPEVQVPRPEVTMQFDVEPELAIATRRRMFDMVARDRLLVAGMHLHFPGHAHLLREGQGYRLLPEPFRLEF
ncbi:metallo-beta-lactamase domain protein [Pseudoroseomonas cervicalis ATCC 49957]|uniref:Metallo-beta-lactamase domain protein n=1 Tax=Pseudoroseomonas cervicalis ATCC 49957 TaxID=525371 RepID=D5RK51_9PROT|nr:metallo-beta-lactamase domain protein [Pseudoroseomonas cervicalis ATCC 49957]